MQLRRLALGAFGAAMLTTWWIAPVSSADPPETPAAEESVKSAAPDAPASEDKPAAKHAPESKPEAGESKSGAGEAPEAVRKVATPDDPVKAAPEAVKTAPEAEATSAKPAEWDVEALEAAVTSSCDRFVEAFTQRDAKAVAALFTEEAEFVDASGVVFHGREAIEAEYEALFEMAPEGQLMLDVVSIRPVAKSVLIEEGVSTIRPAEEQDGPEIEVRYTATHVQQPDGKWLMASLRELSEPNVAPHGRLQALAWLKGSWREELDGHVIKTDWDWSEDGNFLVGKYEIRSRSEVLREGTHRIGWDGARKQFRSWIFDAEGGYSEGGWMLEDEGVWTVQLEGADPNGTRRATLLTYAREGRDVIFISQQHRRYGDEVLPDTAHRIVRQPRAPQQARVGE
ncbi:MAG TPA: SgcJ/EcaC family oxidoreductase [Pirellulales bacterium]